MLLWRDISIDNKAIVKEDIMPEPILHEQVYGLLYQNLDKKINKLILKSRAIQFSVIPANAGMTYAHCRPHQPFSCKTEWP